MSDAPSAFRYTERHEWLKKSHNGQYRVGISDHAQYLLGDLVFIELPVVGAEFVQGDEMGIIESVKATSDYYCPLSGEVMTINQALNDNPSLINQDPYHQGWIFEIKPSNHKEIESLLSTEQYAQGINKE